MDDLEEWLLAKAHFVHLCLKRLVPPPTIDDVRPQRCALGFKRIAKCSFVFLQGMKLNVGHQIWEMHRSITNAVGRTKPDMGSSGRLELLFSDLPVPGFPELKLFRSRP